MNCNNKSFKGKYPIGSRLNVYLIYWAPNSLKENQMLGTGKRKIFEFFAKRGKKSGAGSQSATLCGGGGCCSKSLLRFGGGGEMERKVLVDPFQSPKNLKISRCVVLLPRGIPLKSSI